VVRNAGNHAERLCLDGGAGKQKEKGAQKRREGKSKKRTHGHGNLSRSADPDSAKPLILSVLIPDSWSQ